MRVSSSLLALLLHARESPGAEIAVRMSQRYTEIGISSNSFGTGSAGFFEDSVTWSSEGTDGGSPIPLEDLPKRPLPPYTNREDYDLSHRLCQRVKEETVPATAHRSPLARREEWGNINDFPKYQNYFMASLGPSAASDRLDCGFRGCPTQGADCGDGYTGLFDVALGISAAFDLDMDDMRDAMNNELTYVTDVQIYASDGRSSRSLNLRADTRVQVEEYAEAIPFQHCWGDGPLGNIQDPANISETCVGEGIYADLCMKGWAGDRCTEALTYLINITECTSASPEDWYDKWDCDVEPAQVLRLTRDQLPASYDYVRDPTKTLYRQPEGKANLVHTTSFQMNLTGFDPIFLPSWISGVDIWEESGAAKAVSPLLGSVAAAAAGLVIWLTIPL